MYGFVQPELPFGSVLEWDELRELHDHHVSFGPVLVRAAKRRAGLLSNFNFNHLSVWAILVCTPKRRGWLLQNHQQYGLSLGSVLERYFVRILDVHLFVSCRVPFHGKLLYVG